MLDRVDAITCPLCLALIEWIFSRCFIILFKNPRNGCWIKIISVRLFEQLMWPWNGSKVTLGTGSMEEDKMEAKKRNRLESPPPLSSPFLFPGSQRESARVLCTVVPLFTQLLQIEIQNELSLDSGLLLSFSYYAFPTRWPGNDQIRWFHSALEWLDLPMLRLWPCTIIFMANIPFIYFYLYK